MEDTNTSQWRADSAAPAASVIVPIFNHARFLRERLDSILAQTFRDFEIVLLDDGSTDESPTILREYASHPQVSHVVLDPQNSGRPCRQWRRGLDLARGAFVWIAESDDVAEPSFLEALTDLLRRHEDCVLAYCRSARIDAASARSAEDWFWADGLDPERWHRPFVARGDAEIRDYLRFRNTVLNTSAAVFRRDAANRVAMPEDMVFCGDWVFWVRLLRHGGVAYTPERLNRFRTHDRSTVHAGAAGGSIERRWQRLCEHLRAIGEGGSHLLPWARAGARDHRWLLDNVPGHVLEAARQLAPCDEVSATLRAELLAAVAWRDARRLVARTRGR